MTEAPERIWTQRGFHQTSCRGSASTHETVRHAIGYIRLDIHDAAIAAARAEIEELREELGAFLGVWAVEYAKRMGFPDGDLHPKHFARMQELGLRMVDFRAAAEAQP